MFFFPFLFYLKTVSAIHLQVNMDFIRLQLALNVWSLISWFDPVQTIVFTFVVLFHKKCLHFAKYWLSSGITPSGNEATLRTEFVQHNIVQGFRYYQAEIYPDQLNARCHMIRHWLDDRQSHETVKLSVDLYQLCKLRYMTSFHIQLHVNTKWTILLFRRPSH